MKVDVKQLFEKPESFQDKEVELVGWISTLRSSKHVGFIEVNDGTAFQTVQVVFTDELSNFSEIRKFSIASSIRVVGKVVFTENAKQAFEIQAMRVDALSLADKDFPLQKKRHTFDYLRTIAHLRPRANTFRAVFRVRSYLSLAIHDFFTKNNFVYIHTPLITGIDAEGAGEVFRVTTMDPLHPAIDKEGNVDYSHDFFSKATFLTVSGQLAVEPFAQSFQKVYTFGPTFRSENSNTVRHASEFWMVEPEMAFTNLEGDMDIMEAMIKHIIRYVLTHAPDEMKFFDQRIEKGLLKKLNNVLTSEFKRITYTEAIEILGLAKQDFEYPPIWGKEIQTEHEKYLAKYFDGPVFVTDYPKEIKAFYMKQSEDQKTVRACDLIVPGLGEIIGGSQREDDYEKLYNEMKRRGMKIEEYQWYLDLRRFGMSEQSGFGLGFERMLQYLTGMANIRDVIAYPRTPKNAEM